MDHRDRKLFEAAIRCEIILGALPSISGALGELPAQERVEAQLLLKDATSALWKVHARLGGTKP